MRLVLDTNIVISALLWRGAPRRILLSAHSNEVILYTSIPLLVELDDVLRRNKFQARLRQARVSANDLVLGFAALATVVEPAAIPPVILSDPDDDAVLACALAAQAEAIVSGDSHLLQLGAYDAIPILPAEILIDQMAL